MQWFEQRNEYSVGGDVINIGDIKEARGVSVGQGASASIISQPIGVDYDTMKELLFQLESKVNATGIPIGQKSGDK